MQLTRRRFFALLPPFAGAFFLAACGGDESSRPEPAASDAAPAAPAADAPAATTATQLAPTPACGDADDPTPAQTEGPFFTPNSPERASLLEPGIAGTKLVVEGSVVNTRCQPQAGALLDFWQADAAGQYDNVGNKLRGHQFTDAQGRYRLETILPGLYTGRTRHIHVKAQAKGGAVVTTQLYFPNEPANSRDGIYNAALLLSDYGDAGGGKAGRFDFVLAS